MANRVAFSNLNLELSEIANHHNDVEASLRLYFSNASPNFYRRFSGYSDKEIAQELNHRIAEIELTSTLTVLATLEAAFRIDYLRRCYRKEKDLVSREFREIYKSKQSHASLEKDIFEVWRKYSLGQTKAIGDLCGAFKFRHWLAHGRYWVPKLGQKYDFQTIYALAQTVLTGFPLFNV